MPLETIISGPPVTPERPWLGLRSFDESTREYFFGRDAEIRDLFDRVQHRPLTVLFGQSGLGKTSLLKAGLVPKLTEAGWSPVVMRLDYGPGAASPEAQIISALATATRRALPLGVPLWMLLHDPVHGLREAKVRPVLVLDQFEEIFTLGAQQPGVARELQAALAAIVENRAPDDLDARLLGDDELALRLQYDPPRVRVIVSLREDFLRFIERWKRTIPAVMENRLELQELSGAQALKAVVEPGKIRCKSAPEKPQIVSDATAAAIVRFVAGAEGDVPIDEIDNVPPLLSLICAQLNEQRFASPQDSAPSREDVPIEWVRKSESDAGGAGTTSGGAPRTAAEKALEQFYAGSFDQHPEAVRGFVEDDLVSDAGYREAVTIDGATAELKRQGVEDPAAHIAQLVDQRILVMEEKDGVARIELTHDILATLALRSRRERKQREEEKRREAQLTEERRKARARTTVTILMLVLTVAAVAEAIIANREKGQLASALSSEKQAVLQANQAELEAKQEETEKASALQMAQQQEKAAATANAQIKRNLHEASMADFTAAEECFSEPGKWSEGIAHLTRALRWEPGNVAAIEQLWWAIPENASPPIQAFDHDGNVYSAEYSPDGTRIVTASGDHTARIWDAVSGKEIGQPLQHQADVEFAVFSPDGTRVATACQDGVARIWDATTGKEIGDAIQHNGVVESVQFSRDGTRIVTACSDHSARIWDVATGKQIGPALQHDGAVEDAEFSPDGTRIVTASYDKTARIWDAATGAPIGTPLHHQSAVYTAEFSPDGSRIVTGSDDQAARIWSVATCEEVGQPLRHNGAVFSASYSPDGMLIVTACYDKTARVWSAATGKQVGEPMRHTDVVNSAVFSPDGTRILTSSRDYTALTWDTPTGKGIGVPLPHGDSVYTASFNRDGSKILTASGDKTARVWNAATGEEIGDAAQHDSWVWTAKFNADGSQFVTASDDGTARVWDTATGKEIGNPMQDQGGINSAAFSTDGKQVVTAGADGTARIWDAATGKEIGAPLQHDGGVNMAVFSPDGKQIVTASDDKTARIWDATTGKQTALLQHGDIVKTAEFSADGTRIVTASRDFYARVWNAATGKEIGQPMAHRDIVCGATFSPDGKRVLTCSADDTAQVWDAATGKQIGPPLQHAGTVLDAEFSPDGTRIVTASNDNTARIWDAATGQQIGEPLRHEGQVNSAAFDPTGKRIVTASADHNARIWDLPNKQDSISSLPAWGLGFAEAVGGFSFDANGDLQPVPLQNMAQYVWQLRKGDDTWSVLARWVNSVREQRGTGPYSPVTLRDAAGNERDTLRQDGQEAAIAYDPSIPLAHMLLARFESGDEANFMREFELQHLDAEVDGWKLAAEILTVQHQAEPALRADAVCRWLSGDKDGAVKDETQLIQEKSPWTDPNALAIHNPFETETEVMTALLKETLQRHPEVK